MQKWKPKYTFCSAGQNAETYFLKTWPCLPAAENRKSKSLELCCIHTPVASAMKLPYPAGWNWLVPIPHPRAPVSFPIPLAQGHQIQSHKWSTGQFRRCYFHQLCQLRCEWHPPELCHASIRTSCQWQCFKTDTYKATSFWLNYSHLWDSST